MLNGYLKIGGHLVEVRIEVPSRMSKPISIVLRPPPNTSTGFIADLLKASKRWCKEMGAMRPPVSAEASFHPRGGCQGPGLKIVANGDRNAIVVGSLRLSELLESINVTVAGARRRRHA